MTEEDGRLMEPTHNFFVLGTTVACCILIVTGVIELINANAQWGYIILGVVATFIGVAGLFATLVADQAIRHRRGLSQRGDGS